MFTHRGQRRTSSSDLRGVCGVGGAEEYPTRNRCWGIHPTAGISSVTADLNSGRRMVWLMGLMLIPSPVAVSQSRSKSWPARRWIRWLSPAPRIRPSRGAVSTLRWASVIARCRDITIGGLAQSLANILGSIA